MTEDARLLIMAYCIMQTAEPQRIYAAFKVVENFVDFKIFEEAAPISTMETAFQLILLDYSELQAKSERGSQP